MLAPLFWQAAAFPAGGGAAGTVGCAPGGVDMTSNDSGGPAAGAGLGGLGTSPGQDMVVEIRVHGVSGTPPQDVLCSPWAAQVAGDVNAPIYQPADQLGRTITGLDLTGEGGRPVPRQTEAYHWGEMTSGGWRKAVWALLLPFALVNVGQWMLPPAKPDGFWNGVLKGLLRLAGLVLTCLFMAQAGIAVMDLIVNQCGVANSACPSSLGWLWPHRQALSILGALLLIVVAGLIDQISRTRWPLINGQDRRAELVQERKAAWPVTKTKWKATAERLMPGRKASVPEAGPLAGPASPGLAGEASLYNGDLDAPWLRTVHLTAGLSTVIMLLLGGLHPLPGGWQVAYWAAVVLLGLTVAAAALPFRPDSRPFPTSTVATVALWAGPALTAGLLIAVAAAGPAQAVPFVVRPTSGPGLAVPPTAPAPLSGSDGIAGASMIALSVITLLFAILLAVRRLGPGARAFWARIRRQADSYQPPRPFRPVAAGWFAAPIAALGSLLGAGLGVGYTSFLGACLSGSCNPAAVLRSKPAPSAVTPPPFYGSVAELWAITAAVVLAGLIAGAVYSLSRATLAAQWRGSVPSLAAGLALQLDGEDSSFGPKFRIAMSWQLARWRLSAARLLTALSVLMAATAVLCLEAYWQAAHRPVSLSWLGWLLDWGFLAQVVSWLALASNYGTLAGIGVIVLALVTALLLKVVYDAARRPDAARALGILWDLASYWPRAAHPFVPPCYMQKAVPELMARVRAYREDGYRVVLSAHSQGSLLAVATAMRLAAEDDTAACQGLGLVMGGSQLQWAYPRIFPAVVNYASYQAVMRAVGGRWYVLARGTDPLGGPVLSWNLRVDNGELAAEVLTDGADGRAATGKPDDGGRLVLGQDWWIRDPMNQHSAAAGPRLPWFSTATERHSGYWPAPAWDQAVGRAAGVSPP